MTKTVLFLCTGNYYRSRFAEVYFNHHAKARGLPWQATSRGLALDANNPGPLSRHTLARLSHHEIPSEGYLRLPADLTEADLQAADHVVAVKEAEHRPLMERRFPHWVDRIEFWAVHDVDCAEPAEALPHLEREVDQLVQRLNEVETKAFRQSDPA